MSLEVASCLEEEPYCSLETFAGSFQLLNMGRMADRPSMLQDVSTSQAFRTSRPTESMLFTVYQNVFNVDGDTPSFPNFILALVKGLFPETVKIMSSSFLQLSLS